jgi:glucosamine-6-phosphate deaminase
MTARLVAHGPVTPLVPESVLQTVRTDFWISETLAANIEPDWDKGY